MSYNRNYLECTAPRNPDIAGAYRFNKFNEAIGS